MKGIEQMSRAMAGSAETRARYPPRMTEEDTAKWDVWGNGVARVIAFRLFRSGRN